MQRTTIMLPRDLKLRAVERAKVKGMSLGEIIRESLERALQPEADDSRTRDPLFSEPLLFTGDVPTDLAERHDDYLYGDG